MSFLFSGTSHLTLAQKVAKQYKFTFGKCEIKQFSAGETYVYLQEDVRGKDCTILQTITQDVNNDLMEVFLLADALRRHDASCVNLIMPHFGYARQDRRAKMGEPISSQLVAHLLVSSGISRVITFELHSDQIEGFFDVPVDNLHCYPLFAQHFKKLENVVVVAPDPGAAKNVRRLALLLNAPIAILNKVRPGHHKTEFTHLIGDVKGKNALLFDDMIDTASTVAPACETLLQNEAKEVYISATHAVFSGPAYDRLRESKCKEIVVTDTLPVEEGKLNNLKVLSVVELLKRVL